MALKVVSSHHFVLSLQSQTSLIVSSHHLVLRRCHVSPPHFSYAVGIRHVKRSGRYAFKTGWCTTTMSLHACTLSSSMSSSFFLHFRLTLSRVPSVFVSFSVYCPPFISCSYFIVWLFRLQSFSWGMLALISNQTDLSLDMVIRACRCIVLTGAYAHHVYHGPSPRY